MNVAIAERACRVGKAGPGCGCGSCASRTFRRVPLSVRVTKGKEHYKQSTFTFSLALSLKKFFPDPIISNGGDPEWTPGLPVDEHVVWHREDSARPGQGGRATGGGGSQPSRTPKGGSGHGAPQNHGEGTANRKLPCIALSLGAWTS